jgi:predicted PurR-regulated permease PerM
MEELQRRSGRAVRGHILFAIAMFLLLALMWKLRSVLEIVYISALFAVVLMPIVQRIMSIRIRGYKPSKTVAILALMAAVVLLLTLFFVIALPPVLHDLQGFMGELPKRIPEVIAKIKRLPVANKIGLDEIAAKAENFAGAIASYIFNSAPAIVSHLVDIVTGIVLCIYFMLEGEFAYLYFLAMVPADTRNRISKVCSIAEVRMSKWLIGQGSLMLILGVASVVVFGLLHVRYFILLGVLMGLLNIIPVAGGVATILLAGGVAALDSWSKMAGVFIFYAVYMQVENGFLTPKIMKTSVNLMGLTVLIALLVGTELAGIPGALVSVPTAALVAVLVDEFMLQRDASAEQLIRQADEQS